MQNHLQEILRIEGRVCSAGNKTYALGAAASSIVPLLFDAKPDVNRFAGFFAVDALYNRKSEEPDEKKGVLGIQAVLLWTELYVF